MRAVARVPGWLRLWPIGRRRRAPPPLAEARQVVQSLPDEPSQAPREGVIGAFLIEALVAAGPRKSAADHDGPGGRELGEDVVGLARAGERWVFWLADGTSDSFSLVHGDQVFTARTLARDLGSAFCAAAVRGRGLRAEDMQSLVLDEVARDWQASLSEVIAAVHAQGTLETFLQAFPEVPDGRRQILWSSTLIGGVFDEASGVLEVWNAGDSGALVAARPNGVIEPRRQRIFVVTTLTPEPGGAAVEVAAVGAKDCTVVRFEEVTGFVAMTDGVIDGKLADVLGALRDSLGRQSLTDIRRGLLRRCDRSHDDKAIVFARYLANDDA
jgi:hypothetical protein